MKQITSAFEPVSFNKNDFIFNPNRRISHYYFIESGFARSFVINAEGNEITTEFFSEGQIVIDWPAFFMRSSTSEYCKAVTSMDTWKISFGKFQTLFDKISGFRESGRSRLIKSFFLMKQRHIDLITKPAKERYLTLMSLHPEVFEYASLKDIASYLGMTDTSLSRIRRELTK